MALYERRKAVVCRDRTAALLTIAATVIHRYQDEKAKRGLLEPLLRRHWRTLASKAAVKAYDASSPRK